jgi:hypothetical protein
VASDTSPATKGVRPSVARGAGGRASPNELPARGEVRRLRRMHDVNLLAVFLAALSSFLLGGLWYSPALFGVAWNVAEGRDPSKKGRHPALVFGLSFVLALVAAYVTAVWLGRGVALGTAVQSTAIAGVGLVAAFYGINYLFAGRALKLWLIDAGYHVVQLVLYGLVIALLG